MLMVVVIFAIGSVVSLMILASRYNGILEKRAKRTNGSRITRRANPAAPRSLTPSPAASGTVETVEPSIRDDAAAERIEALRYVDAFIEIRSEIKRALPQAAAGNTQVTGDRVVTNLQALTGELLDGSELSAEDYRKVREIYRGWRAGGRTLTRPFAEAFELRRNELIPIDLGPFESYDL